MTRCSSWLGFITVLSIQLIALNMGSVSAAETKIGPSDRANELKEQANEAFWNRNFAQAKKLVMDIVQAEPECSALARLYVNMAICDAQLENWTEARKEAEQGIGLAKRNSLTESDGLATLARCQIIEGKNAKAKESYQQAINIATSGLGDWNCDLAHLYEGLAACYVHDQELSLARNAYKKVAELDYLKYGPDDTHLGWSFLSLSGVADRLGDHELAVKLYKKVFWNFRHQNEQRIMQEVKPSDSEREKIQMELRRQLYGFNEAYQNQTEGLDYIRADIPQIVLDKPVSRTQDFENWFKDRVGREKAPGLAYFDPRQK